MNRKKKEYCRNKSYTIKYRKQKKGNSQSLLFSFLNAES